MNPLADQRELDARPPCPRAIYTSHSVPYGRVFRQWTTRGDLVIWVSRGEFEDMPRIPATHFDVFHRPMRYLPILGIPVYNK